MIRSYNKFGTKQSVQTNVWLVMSRDGTNATCAHHDSKPPLYNERDGDRYLGKATYPQVQAFVAQIQTDTKPVPSSIAFQFNVFMATQI